MSENICFTVMGKPVGKGRPRFSNAGGFTRTYTPAKTVEFENLVRLEYQMEGGTKMSGNIAVSISAYFPIPKSLSKKKRAELQDMSYPKKPDVDNICKVVLDALNGIAYDDDSQVVAATVRKFYSDQPRTFICMWEVE